MRVEFRIGVNTGPVVAGSRDAGSALVTGDAVNVAARLEQSAPVGAILIGQPTFQLVRDQVRSEPVEPVIAKGKSEPIAAHLVLGMAAGTGPRGIGDRVRRPAAGARATRTGIRGLAHRATLPPVHPARLGWGGQEPAYQRVCRFGVRRRARPARPLPVVRRRASPTGRSARSFERPPGLPTRTTRPLPARRISASLGSGSDSERIVELVSAAIGLIETSAPRDELSWGIRRYLEELANPRGLVCVVEDIHWAEPTLLDLIEFMADWTRDSAILLICTARPELLEARTDLGWRQGELHDALARAVAQRTPRRALSRRSSRTWPCRPPSCGASWRPPREIHSSPKRSSGC